MQPDQHCRVDAAGSDRIRSAISRDVPARVTIMSADNVHKHDALQRKKKQKTSKAKHEDLCGYCERYSQSRLSVLKKQEIEVWTTDVNHNMGLPDVQAKKKTKKLKFMTYSPPGTADEEKGFRWVPTAKHGATAGLKENWGKDRNADKIRLEVDRVSIKSEKGSVDDNTCSEDTSRLLVPKCNPGYTPSSDESVETKATGGTVESDSTTSLLNVRTFSNRLLNVLTIDDALYHDRGRFLSTGGTNSKPHNPKKSYPVIGPIREGSAYRMTDGKPSDMRGRIESIAQFKSEKCRLLKEYRYDSPEIPRDFHDGPVMRALNHVMASRVVTNDNRGIFKLDKSCTYPSTLPSESRRFQHMNKTLHKLMDTEYIPNTRLNKRRRKQAERLTSCLSVTDPENKSISSSIPLSKNNDEVFNKSELKPTASHSSIPRSKTNDEVFNKSELKPTASNACQKTERRKQSQDTLLGMLMDLQSDVGTN